MLGRGFTVKCKALTKATRARIDVVRRRADAKQRFLKDDLAKLLSNGLDINAYGRTEEFLSGKDLLACYDFIEYSCGYISKQLSRMQKQGDCPEECREAVASLMYAAARFSDLPELRELRDIFQQKYGYSLESFVNQKFVEKLSSRPPTSEKRLQVLQDIASEISIKWDSRGFERRMATSSAVAQVDVQKVDIVKHRPGILEEKKSRVGDCGEDNILKRDESNQRLPFRKENTENREKSVLRVGGSSLQGDGGDLLAHGRLPVTERKVAYPIEKGDVELKVERSKSSSHGKIILDNSVRTGYMKPSDGIHNPLKGENKESLFYKKAEFAPSSLEPLGRTGNDISYNYSSQDSDVLNSVKKEGDKSKPSSSYALPPPYVKAKDSNNTPRPPYTRPKEDEHRHGKGSMHASPYKLRPNIGLGSGDGEERLIENAKKNDESEKVLEKAPLPKPRPIRRKHHTSSSSYNVEDALEDDIGAVASRSSSGRRKDHSGKGMQILFEEEHHKKDDEEMMIDKLLFHYSKKPSSYDADKLRKRPGPQKKADVGESSDRGRDNRKPGVLLTQSTRSVSLPPVQPTSPQSKKIFTRANSFQPDTNQAHYVHPKLPDYDDLAARFAALKGT